MDILKKHVDTIIILGGVLSSVLWMNHQFNGVNGRIAKLEQDIAVIKTVLIMKSIMPSELASRHDIAANEK